MSSDKLKVFKIIETLLKTNSLLTEKLTASYSSGDSLITPVVIGKKKIVSLRSVPTNYSRDLVKPDISSYLMV